MSKLSSYEGATMVGLLTTVGVYLIYNNALPNATDIRSEHPHNEDIEAERKHAAWKSAALLGVVFLVSRDVNSYIISGVGLVGVDYMYKHANAVHPATGKLDDGSDGTVMISQDAEADYSLADYGSVDQEDMG